MSKKYITELTRILPRMRRVLVRHFSSVLTKGDVTLPQMILLEFLQEKTACTVSAIAKELRITLSAVTGMADRLVRSKLISRMRGSQDRRVVIISLTSKGKTLLTKMLSEQKKMIKHMFSGLTDNERKTYLGILKKMYTGIEKK